ncbi:MAG: hypothetical protein Q9219_005565 [cf. Caloplaca sp. 3 TL-2023]
MYRTPTLGKDPYYNGNPIHAWNELNPDEQLPYITRNEAAFKQYDADIQAYNARIPLSPLVHFPPTARESWFHQSRLERMRGSQIWNRYRKDHPEACGGAITPVPDQPFRFLSLPPELRGMVYSLLLCRRNPIVQMETNHSATRFHAPSDEGPIDLRILAVCKQLYEEAMRVFLGQNVMLIELGPKNLPPIFRAGPQMELLKCLKRVKIELCIYQPAEVDRLSWLLDRVFDTLTERTQLTAVTIVPCLDGWYNPRLEYAMDDVLDAVGILDDGCKIWLASPGKKFPSSTTMLCKHACGVPVEPFDDLWELLRISRATTVSGQNVVI